jgi:hypothetical protein
MSALPMCISVSGKLCTSRDFCDKAGPAFGGEVQVVDVSELSETIRKVRASCLFKDIKDANPVLLTLVDVSVEQPFSLSLSFFRITHFSLTLGFHHLSQ